jgi:hypothetical protein
VKAEWEVEGRSQLRSKRRDTAQVTTRTRGHKRSFPWGKTTQGEHMAEMLTGDEEAGNVEAEWEVEGRSQLKSKRRDTAQATTRTRGHKRSFPGGKTTQGEHMAELLTGDERHTESVDCNRVKV